MATSNQMTEAENAAHSSNVPIDPFAVDFFGGTTPLSDENELFSEKEPKNRKRLKAQKKSDWYKNLPQITNAEAEFSNLLWNLPEKLTERAAGITAGTIAKYTFRPPENVRCALNSVAETNLNEALNQLTEEAHIFWKISCQPENTSAVIALNTGFAKTLIDLVLGGQGAELNNLRDISPIEATIIEFLAANILGEINNFLGENLLCPQKLENNSAVFFEPFERGAKVVINLEIDGFNGVINLFAPQRFLNSLDRSQNPLFTKKSDRKNLKDYERIAGALSLRLQLGTTFLDADSLLFLEANDIVLVEQPQINLGNGNFGNNLQVLAGSGRNFRFRGNAGIDQPSGNLNFTIEEILSEETRRKFTPVKFRMDEMEKELAEVTNPENVAPIDEEAQEEVLEEQVSPALENVQVALRVEIAGNKISLRELQGLRAGQILALGCSPTDPVRLVTDSNEEPVATGELVEIEGQLGVRLMKVFI